LSRPMTQPAAHRSRAIVCGVVAYWRLFFLKNKKEI